MRWLPVAVALLLAPIAPAKAQVTVAIGSPGIDIGIHMAAFPELVLVPGYPVYYAPGADWNYFFYDGLYWVYVGDAWYASSWYDGPWYPVEPLSVPLFVLRVPVRYYRAPPAYFRAWRADAPPRWGEHWGRDWERRRPGWNRWDRHAVPRAAPLPAYQRSYTGDRYPRAVEQQRALRAESYRYRPRETVTRQHYQQPQRAPPQPARGGQPARPAQQPQRQQPPARQGQWQRPQPQPRPQQPSRPQPPQGAQQPRQAPQRGQPQQRGGDRGNVERGPERR